MAISVENEYECEQSGQETHSIDIGTAFVGTLEDVNGDDKTGVFIRTNEGIVFLDDVEAEFDTPDSYNDDLAKVRNYKNADITVRVDDTWE
jgi:hypothetical protein